MLLSARIITNVYGINAFEYAPSMEFTEGDGPTIYFQLVDLTTDRGFDPPGRRYVPAVGATLECVIHNIDDARKVTRFAAQPFPQDTSLWSVTLQSTDRVKGVSDILLTLTEGARVTRGAARSVVIAHPQLTAR